MRIVPSSSIGASPSFVRRTVQTLLRIAAIAVVTTAASPAIAQDTPKTILARGAHLEASKQRIARGDTSLKAALDALVVRAREALDAPALSVTQKQHMPPSGDTHDYMSMAPYWWPNAQAPGGRPYVRRDGEINPASRTDHDGLRLQQTIARVKTLAYAWYFTGDARYAEGAASRVRVFFIDAATRMHPHLRYGQAILGVTDGRGTGLIDTRTLPDLVDALRVLDTSPAWTPDDREAMTTWCRSFLAWMLESPHGREERAAPNNHGVFYDAQVAALALYVGDVAVARAVLVDSARARLAAQIAPDGALPLELERTRPLHYSVFTLDAFTMLAEMGRHVGTDLWRDAGPSGERLAQALRVVAPYAGAPSTFPRKDVTPVDVDVFLRPLRRAVFACRDDAFVRALGQLPPALLRTDLSRFEFP